MTDRLAIRRTPVARCGPAGVSSSINMNRMTHHHDALPVHVRAAIRTIEAAGFQVQHDAIPDTDERIIHVLTATMDGEVWSVTGDYPGDVVVELVDRLGFQDLD